MTVTWDLLLPTMPHRHVQLVALLAELDRQAQPGFGMLLYRDNLQRRGNASYGKWQDLQEWSTADYTSFIADDDWVAPDFVAKVMAALELTHPDYVGFRVKYTVNGVQQMPVENSLRHSGWENSKELLTRDIEHHCPIARHLALQATWRTDIHHADRQWADDLRPAMRFAHEAFIPEELYWYQETDDSWTPRYVSNQMWEPLPESEIRPLPVYDWLTVRDEAYA